MRETLAETRETKTTKYSERPAYRSPRGDRFSLIYRLLYGLQCIHLADPPTVPRVAQMRSLAAVLYESRPVDRKALPASVAHAVEDDSVRPGELQATCEFLRRNVAVRVIDVGHPVTFPANVV